MRRVVPVVLLAVVTSAVAITHGEQASARASSAQQAASAPQASGALRPTKPASASQSPAKPAPVSTASTVKPAPAVSHSAAAMSASAQNELVGKYCTTCHSARAKAGGLVLADFDAAKITENGELTEKIIRKLRARMMPPSGAPRPDDATVMAMVNTLESSMDKLAAATPRPGWRPFQRLNRAEYASAVEDLLGLDVDVAAWLPPDTISGGFDNVSDVQSFSPQLMQGYLRAASQISRLAVGDRTASPTSATFKIEHSRNQMIRAAGAPIGTRGGISIVHVFPADGDYVIKTSMIYAALGGLFGRQPLLSMGFTEQLDVSINGQRVALLDISPTMTETDFGQNKGQNGMEVRTPSDPHQGRPAAHLRRVHPAPRRPARRPARADREHRRGRRRLRHHHPPAHARPHHRRPEYGDRRVGDGEPPEHLHLPSDQRRGRGSLRGEDPASDLTARAYRGKGGAARPAGRDEVLRGGQQDRRLRERHPHGAAVHPRQPALRVPHGRRSPASESASGVYRLGRSRPGVAAVLLHLGHRSGRRN